MSTWKVFLVMGLLTVVLVPVMAVVDAQSEKEKTGPKQVKLRIGTYDNRSVAVAYVHSSFLQDIHRNLKTEFDQAEAAGDKAKQEAIKLRGKTLQQLHHHQGFSRAPVDDILKHIESKLPQIAQKAGVDMIAWQIDYISDAVEVVDVTDLIVAEFQPTEKTLKIIDGLKKHPPVSILELMRMELEGKEY